MLNARELARNKETYTDATTSKNPIVVLPISPKSPKANKFCCCPQRRRFQFKQTQTPPRSVFIDNFKYIDDDGESTTLATTNGSNRCLVLQQSTEELEHLITNDEIDVGNSLNKGNSRTIDNHNNNNNEQWKFKQDLIKNNICCNEIQQEIQQEQEEKLNLKQIQQQQQKQQQQFQRLSCNEYINKKSKIKYNNENCCCNNNNTIKFYNNYYLQQQEEKEQEKYIKELYEENEYKSNVQKSLENKMTIATTTNVANRKRGSDCGLTIIIATTTQTTPITTITTTNTITKTIPTLNKIAAMTITENANKTTTQLPSTITITHPTTPTHITPISTIASSSTTTATTTTTISTSPITTTKTTIIKTTMVKRSSLSNDSTTISLPEETFYGDIVEPDKNVQKFFDKESLTTQEPIRSVKERIAAFKANSGT